LLPAKHWRIPYFPRRNALDSVRVQVLTLTEALVGNSVSRGRNLPLQNFGRSKRMTNSPVVILPPVSPVESKSGLP
jgi:hypothetical protein